jgi:phosphoglucosamine mutase
LTRKIFGTDGIRGTVNKEPLTASTILKAAQATGLNFMRGNHRHLVVIAKDTRLSGYMLEPALTSGFTSVGMDVILVGPMPTPAVSMLIRSLRADLGIMISASHNLANDNGIKIFGPDGHKLPDSIEKAIEEKMDSLNENDLAAAASLGRAKRLDDAPGRYIEHVKSTFPKGKTLKGLKVVIDCAHGAAYKIAPTVLWELGASIIPIGVQPDGLNINQNVGATSTELLRKTVKENNADIGIALDGDADRIIVSDENGEIVDGDQIIAALAWYWKQKGTLNKNTVVTTQMSNIGLDHFLKENGIQMIRSQVGDRYVSAEMFKNGYNLGGEQSGHIILSDYGTTGDGLLAGLQVLSLLVDAKKPASQILRKFIPVPQLLENYRFKNKNLLEDTTVKKAIQQAEKTLKQENGRLLIRKSGTEPLVRVMGECEDAKVLKSSVAEIIHTLQSKDS